MRGAFAFASRIAMSDGIWAGRPPRETRDALLLRGGALQTFSGLAIFVSATLLCGGSYLFAYEIANPLGAISVVVLLAAMALAIAAILLYYLVCVQVKVARRSPGGRGGQVTRPAPRTSSAFREVVAQSDGRRDLPFQRWYVDPVRIRR